MEGVKKNCDGRVKGVILPWMQVLMSKFLCLEKDLERPISYFLRKTIRLLCLKQSRTLTWIISFKSKTGGKLYIAGEYAILTPSQSSHY